jgi:DNA primase
MALDPTTEEIKRRADITEVVSQYVSLVPAGNGRMKACCPFHDEKTPSFYVSRDKGFYKCFGCGASGDSFKFVQAMENVDFLGARKILGARYNVEIKERRDMTPEQKEKLSERDKLLKVCAAAAHFFREQFSGNAGLSARDYARKRGLSRETVEKFGIGYAPDNWDSLKNNLTRKYGFSEEEGVSAGLFIEKKSAEDDMGGLFAEKSSRRVYDRYRHRLMFPIWDESGRVIAFGGRALDGGQTGNPDAKYINSPESPLFHKSNIMFAWHLARAEVSKREGIIVTEGYMDAIAMHEGGFPQTVATLGTALTAQHVALLRRVAPKVVYLCFDGDSAGMRAALRTAPLFAENALDVRVVRLPVGHDPDTFIRDNGTIGMENALKEAIPLARYRLVSILEAHNLEDVESRAEAMRQAAEIINDLGSETERAGYVGFIVDELLKSEKPGNRGAWERRRGDLERLVKNELRADEGRAGQKERLRDAKIGDGRLAPVREKRFSTPNPKWEAIRLEQEKEANDLHEATQSISDATGIAPGVLKAEKSLIAALLSHPVWRGHIMEKLPLSRWTDETHGEIVVAARKFEPGEEISPVDFIENLSEEAQKVVGEVMLSDEASALPDAIVINDWIARVEMHWARQAEAEMLEVLKGKIDREEKISEAEREALAKVLAATKRKMPVPQK